MYGVQKQIVAILGAVACIFAASQVSGQFQIDWFTVDGGGAMNTTAGALSLSGTAGQPEAGMSMTGGDFSLTGGFWFKVAPGDCNNDGAVGLQDYAALNACLTGPGGSSGGGCACFDFDSDADSDLADFREFQILFSGGS
jgi:hypothetical protein